MAIPLVAGPRFAEIELAKIAKQALPALPSPFNVVVVPFIGWPFLWLGSQNKKQKGPTFQGRATAVAGVRAS